MPRREGVRSAQTIAVPGLWSLGFGSIGMQSSNRLSTSCGFKLHTNVAISSFLSKHLALTLSCTTHFYLSLGMLDPLSNADGQQQLLCPTAELSVGSRVFM